ncbi:MAG: hypothetical protein ACYDG0_01265 [Vulcanimicrobiaceae bacterium]|jgi:phosphoribosylformylglycinamidine (FGAM) synthase PurS component
MSERSVAIALKIPDNAAYTALLALRRLGVRVARVERAQILQFDDGGDAGAAVRRIARNEALFNPNVHELEVLEKNVPRPGEAWIEMLRGEPEAAGGSGVRRSMGWRLYTEGDTPADAATVRAAVEALLCNPAIERAILE